MGFKGKNICRLCLKIAKNEFKKIDEVIKQVFDILLLKLDLDITSDPIICQGCVEEAKKCLDFKSICLGTERIILSFSTDRENVKYDISVIYKESLGVEIVDQDLGICRICITQNERYYFDSLEGLKNEAVLFEILPEYMPEIDFAIIENPLICTTCRKNLEGYFKFVMNCLASRRKIKDYCKENDIDRVNLRIVQNFLFNYNLGCRVKCPMKEESKMFEDRKCLYPENQLMKHEELDIKEEDFDMDENSSKNLSEMRLDKCKRREENDDKKMYKCSSCAFKSKWKTSLHKHLLVHKDISEIKMYKCFLCAYQSKQKSSLKPHMLVHKNASEMKMYKCSLCAFETKWKNCLDNHLLAHKDVSEIKMHKCSLCAYKSKLKKNLKRHLFVHRNISEIRRHNCPMCDFQAKQKRNLNSHMLLHKDVSEVKMHKCYLCAFETKWKYNLKSHILIHKDVSEIKMHKCSLFAYSTKFKGNLKIHTLVHRDVSKIKMHKCSLCTYEAKRKGDLVSHMFVHKDVLKIKMHKCSLCAYESKRAHNLKSHMLIHKD